MFKIDHKIKCNLSSLNKPYFKGLFYNFRKYLMSNFIENLVVDKEKKGSYLLGLQEGNQVNDIIFTSPIVRTPFGIENFKNKQNINVEFTGLTMIMKFLISTVT